jgi:ribose-phosphate pyrophosphokinase
LKKKAEKELLKLFFPDGETYVRIVSDVKDKKVFLVCTLISDTKLLPLYFLRRPQKNLEPKAFALLRLI